MPVLADVFYHVVQTYLAFTVRCLDFVFLGPLLANLVVCISFLLTTVKRLTISAPVNFSQRPRKAPKLTIVTILIQSLL